MNYFWGNIFDYFKERRAAGTFYGALVALALLFVFCFVSYQLLCALKLEGYLAYLPALLVLFLSVQIVRTVARIRALRKNRYRFSPLSRDELNKARSKLLTVKRQ